MPQGNDVAISRFFSSAREQVLVRRLHRNQALEAAMLWPATEIRELWLSSSVPLRPKMLNSSDTYYLTNSLITSTSENFSEGLK